MASAFQERFKGKTSLMTKEGVDGVIKDSDNPIRKLNERPPIQMEDFTGAHRYQSQKKEAQTFDINRPFFSPDRSQNANIYSVTYSKPNKSVDQHLLVHNQQQQMIPGMYQQGLPPRYPQQVIQYSRPQGGMNEMDSIDQQMEQIKFQQQMQNQKQQQIQISQGSRQGFNSNQVTPNNKIPVMKQTFQTDNGVMQYQSNGYPQQASSLNSIKSNGSASGKKPHLNAPISANINSRNMQPSPGLNAIPFKGLNSVQSSNSTTSSLQQKNFTYQKDLIDTKFSNGSQFNNIQAKNGYNMIYNNLNSSYQQNSREMLLPIQSNYPNPQMNSQQSQQQPGYQYMSQNNNVFANNLPSLSHQKPYSQSPMAYDHPDLNTRAYSAKFKIKTLEKQENGSNNLIDFEHQYEEAPFLKGSDQRKTEVKRVRNNQSRDTTNKSFNEMPSSSNNLNNYKPYTLNEYKNIQRNSNYKLGGLGPNIGNDDWMQKKELQDKRQEFAKQIQSINTQLLKSQQEQGKIAAVKFTKEVSNREKALEFAKNIPKPQVIPNKQSQSTNALGTNNTLPSQSSQQIGLKEKGRENFNNIENEIQSENLLQLNNSRNAYSSINNYQSHQDPYSNEQENQPNLSMGLNQDIDFHEQQHLEFLNQIEKITK